MTMHLSPERLYTGEPYAAAGGLPVVIEFTSSRARTRPIAARAGGIDLNGTGRLSVRAADIDAFPELRRRFRVTLLPTFVVLQDACELARIVGPHTRRELAAALRRALDPEVVRVDAPEARGLWNEFSVRLWGFVAGS